MRQVQKTVCILCCFDLVDYLILFIWKKEKKRLKLYQHYVRLPLVSVSVIIDKWNVMYIFSCGIWQRAISQLMYFMSSLSAVGCITQHSLRRVLCSLCGSLHPLINIVSNDPNCSHCACASCLTSYIEGLKMFDIYPLECWHQNCGEKVSDVILSHFSIVNDSFLRRRYRGRLRGSKNKIKRWRQHRAVFGRFP